MFMSYTKASNTVALSKLHLEILRREFYLATSVFIHRYLLKLCLVYLRSRYSKLVFGSQC